MESTKFPIRTVSRLTGLSPDNIRVWERRYGAVIPDREKGSRLYGEADIMKLKLLKRAVDGGHGISQIANLSIEALKSLPIAGAKPKRANVERVNRVRPEVDDVMDAFSNFHFHEAESMLRRMAGFLEGRVFVKDVAIPLFHMVGEAWSEGNFSVAQEHMVSASIRNILGMMMQIQPRSSKGQPIVLATTPGEHHEFGVLSAALLVVSAGIEALYLGPNLPIDDIIQIGRKVHARAVVVGFVNLEGRHESRASALHRLSEGLPKNRDLVVGGGIDDALKTMIGDLEGYYLPTLESFEAHIMRYQSGS